MNRTILLISLAMLFFTCENKVVNSTTCCDPDGEFAEQEWLEAWKSHCIDRVCEVSLYKGECSGQTVFYARMTDILCDGTPEAYLPYLIDCKGNPVSDSSTCYRPTCFGEIKEVKLLGRCN